MRIQQVRDAQPQHTWNRRSPAFHAMSPPIWPLTLGRHCPELPGAQLHLFEKPLELPDDPDDQEEEGDEEEAVLDTIEEEKVPGEENKDPNLDEDEPKIEDVIDSKAEKKNDQIGASAAEPNAIVGENVHFEELTQDIFENLGLCEQIINDFKSVSLLPKESEVSDVKKALRSKIMSCLVIDSLLRRAEYAKFYQDVPAAISDFTEVIKCCKQYPEGNQRVMGSAFFNLGQIHLEMNQRDQALEHFSQVETVLKECLYEKL